MAQSLVQRSFAGGEIAPDLYGRADQAKYQTGLKNCRNFIVMRHGGVTNRSGTEMLQEVKDSAIGAYFIKFVYNDAQTYVIEAGDFYFRFYSYGARIGVSGVAAYNGATTYALGDLVSYLGVNYYSKIDGNTGHQPDISPTQWYALTGTTYEIPTPYSIDDVPLLQFFQSADVVTILHPTYEQRELTRTGHTAWKLQTISFAPSISAPSGVTNSGAAGATSVWAVTAVKADTYEESLQSADTSSSAAGATISWGAVTGAAEYNVYKKTNGVYGYIGVAIGTSFVDTGSIVPDVTITPPVSRNPFNAVGSYPSTGGYYQQRRIFANTDTEIEKIWTTRSGMSRNLTISSPLQSDDAVTFSLQGKKVHEIRHLFDLGTLVVLTSTGEWVVEGDADGVLRADVPPNPRQIGYNGAAELTPIVIGNSLVFLQARGSIIRDLRNEVSAQGSQNYNGRDLTVFAPHFFEGYTLSRSDYAQIPHSIAWYVRSDGKLLGLTYLREHEVWGWHIHDTDGFYEDVCCVPEGEEDAVYVIVRRTINGVTKRYVERFVSRRFTDIRVDAIFLDSYLTYDGRNTTATTLSLSTSAGWTVDDDITITASAAQFTAAEVGNWYKMDIVDADGNLVDTVTMDIIGYSDTTHVTARPSKTVPVTLRGVATADWTRMVDGLAGLDHLEGKDVAALGDGNVIANPNNADYTVRTVTGGIITLDKPYGIIHVGLPYMSDFQTLDLDIEGTDIRAKHKNVTHIKLLVKESRGIFAGEDFDTLDELTPSPITEYGEPWPLRTGIVTMPIASTWNESGGFAVRQIDPLPLTILAAIPSGDMGG